MKANLITRTLRMYLFNFFFYCSKLKYLRKCQQLFLHWIFLLYFQGEFISRLNKVISNDFIIWSYIKCIIEINVENFGCLLKILFACQLLCTCCSSCCTIQPFRLMLFLSASDHRQICIGNASKQYLWPRFRRCGRSNGIWTKAYQS